MDKPKNEKRIIDVACGSKMFWFDKHNTDAEFCDKRKVPYHGYYPGLSKVDVAINQERKCAQSRRKNAEIGEINGVYVRKKEV